MGLGFKGLGFRGLGFRILGSEVRVSYRLRVRGLESRVRRLGVEVLGLGLKLGVCS